MSPREGSGWQSALRPALQALQRSTPRSAQARAAAAVAALLLSGAGCGGGMPLLHPARTLGAGEVRAATGMSGNFALTSLGESLNAARNEAAANPGAPGPPGSDPTYAKGALVAASIGPGLAPFVAARVGVGAQAEGGISYTGRGVRIDMRRSFDFGAWSLSLGGGVSAAFYGNQEGGTLPNVDLSSLQGFGADVPILFGWRSEADLFQVWFGARGGWEHARIETLTSEPRPTLPGSPIELSATRFYGGGLVGLAAGFRHVHVALELDLAYQTISGAYNATQVDVSGLSMAPAAAIWWTF
jgi:hypothetical protein